MKRHPSMGESRPRMTIPADLSIEDFLKARRASNEAGTRRETRPHSPSPASAAWPAVIGAFAYVKWDAISGFVRDLAGKISEGIMSIPGMVMGAWRVPATRVPTRVLRRNPAVRVLNAPSKLGLKTR
jgi:hypothetical protein